MTELICKICEEEYTDENGTRIPKVLTECGHTICLECAKKLTIQAKLICPFDRISSDVPEGKAKNLRKNFAILDMIDEKFWKMRLNKNNNTNSQEDQKEKNVEDAEQKALNISCDEDSSHLAVLYCIKCEANLCKRCSLITHSSNLFFNHRRVKLTEKPEPLVYCQAHPHNVAELVCKNEECSSESRIMCHTCHLYGTHKGHEHELIITEYEYVKAKLQEAVEMAVEKEKTCRTHIGLIKSKMDSHSNSTSTDVQKKRDQLHVYFQNMRSLLDEWETNAEEELRRFTSSKYDTLTEIKKPYEAMLRDIEHRHKNMTEILKLYKVDVVSKKAEGFESADFITNTTIKDPEGLSASSDFCLTFPVLNQQKLTMHRCMKVVNVHFEIYGKNELVQFLLKNASDSSHIDEDPLYCPVFYENVHIRLWNQINCQEGQPGVFIYRIDQSEQYTHCDRIEQLKLLKEEVPQEYKIVVAVNEYPGENHDGELTAMIDEVINVDSRVVCKRYSASDDESKKLLFSQVLELV